MVGFAPEAEMVAEAERVRDRYGITTFKVKVGRRPVEIDLRACRALRNALGPNVEVYIDGNHGWTPAEAARALRVMPTSTSRWPDIPKMPGVADALCVHVADDGIVIVVVCDTADSLQRVHHEVGSPWVRQNLTPYLASTDRKVGPVIARPPAT